MAALPFDDDAGHVEGQIGQTCQVGRTELTRLGQEPGQRASVHNDLYNVQLCTLYTMRLANGHV